VSFRECRVRFVIDGSKIIVQRQEGEAKVEECTFEANEVYAVDICFSSGEGKVRSSGPSCGDSSSVLLHALCVVAAQGHGHSHHGVEACG
jgi:hypothetical protein